MSYLYQQGMDSTYSGSYGMITADEALKFQSDTESFTIRKSPLPAVNFGEISPTKSGGCLKLQCCVVFAAHAPNTSLFVAKSATNRFSKLRKEPPNYSLQVTNPGITPASKDNVSLPSTS